VKIISGRRAAPFNVFLFGPQGAGKSTCAADFPDPLFLSAQEGSSELDVKRWCFDEKTERTFALTWDEVIDAMTKIKAEKGFKTLVIDELQAIELLCAAHICKRERKASLGEVGGGYGKGEVALLAEMRILLKLAEEVWASGKNVVFCSHSKQGKVPRPESGETYMRYEPALTTVNNADVSGMFVGWVSACLFLRPEVSTAVKGEKATAKTIGVSTGRRIMATEGEAAWVAKCRYKGVDAVIEVPSVKPMADFFKQVEDGRSVDAMKARVKDLADKAGGDWPAMVGKWLGTNAANDLAALHERASLLKDQVPAAAAA